MFHRLVVPSYFGGLPPGFDYLNNPALSGGAGVPVAMDDQKVGGPNDGTYAVAFGEDASSNFANRGIKALGENTDAIDDILRRDLAITARTDDVVAGAPVTSVVFVGGQGDVFVGAFGVPNNQATRDTLISVLNSADEEILTAAGVKVVVASIVDNNIAMTNLVGTQASGFFNSPTVNFNVPIPVGTTYRLYYGERSNLAALPIDAFTTIKIRGAQEVSADVERTLRDLHASDATVWDSAWLTTINQLAVTGLDGRYRNRTSDPGSGQVTDAGGSGAEIFRDGKAVTLICPSTNWSLSGGFAFHLPDPTLACFRVARQVNTISSDYNVNFGGDIGIVQESPYHSVIDANEGAFNHVAGPAVLDMTWRNYQANTLQGQPSLSKITYGAVAHVNPDALAGGGDRITVEVAAGDYISSGGIQGIRTTDLVELTDQASGAIIGTYRFGAFLSPTRFQLRGLSGATPPFPANVATPVFLRWLQPTMKFGGRYREGANDTQGMPYFTVAAPSPAVSDWDTNRTSINSIFLSALIERQLSVANDLHFLSTAWGGFKRTGHWEAHGFLYGDGGIFTNGGRQQLNLISRRAQSFPIFGGGADAVSWNPFNGGQVQIYSNAALGVAAPIAFTLDATTGYAPAAGDEFDVYIELDPGSAGPMSITWPADFNFSGADGVIPAGNAGPNPIVTHYQFRYAQTPTITGWFATRTDF